MSVLPQSFFARESEIVAVELLGHRLVFEQNGKRCSGLVVETEAYYGPEDPASHAWRGKTKRNAVMFGPAGISYVYFTYGSCHLLNVVTRREGEPGAVLIRALEPLEGIPVMKRRRGVQAETELASGPGKLTQALGITLKQNGLNMTGGRLRFEENTGLPDFLTIRAAKRIGISRGQELLYRFYIRENPHVSK